MIIIKEIDALEKQKKDLEAEYQSLRILNNSSSD